MQSIYIQVFTLTYHSVPIDFIFDLHSFDEHQSDPFTQFVSKHSHKIDPTVTTVSFRATPGKVNLQLFEKWLQSLLWPPKTLLGPPNASRNISAPHVLRFKALLNAADTEYKVVAQSVQETYDITYSPTPWTVEEGARESKLVFIGKGLDMVALRDSFLYFCFDVNVNQRLTPLLGQGKLYFLPPRLSSQLPHSHSLQSVLFPR